MTDTSFHPKTASYGILITPVVCIICENASFSLEKPAIIELAKTIELSDKEANNKVIPLCANSESSEWKELGSKCNCKVLNDRISFQLTYFSLFAVISCKPYPSLTVTVKPASADIPTPDRPPSTPTELTVPELSGFKVQIPPSASTSIERLLTLLLFFTIVQLFAVKMSVGIIMHRIETTQYYIHRERHCLSIHS